MNQRSTLSENHHFFCTYINIFKNNKKHCSFKHLDNFKLIRTDLFLFSFIKETFYI